MPLVRTMFEGLVNASYIRAHPDTADDFIRYLFSYIKKVQTQAEQLNGRIPTPAEKQRIDDALNSLPAPTSKIPPKNDWTPVNLVDRAKAVGLGQHVVVAYYRPHGNISPVDAALVLAVETSRGYPLYVRSF